PLDRANPLPSITERSYASVESDQHMCLDGWPDFIPVRGYTRPVFLRGSGRPVRSSGTNNYVEDESPQPQREFTGRLFRPLSISSLLDSVKYPHLLYQSEERGCQLGVEPEESVRRDSVVVRIYFHKCNDRVMLLGCFCD